MSSEEAARRYTYDPSQREVIEPQLQKLGYALPDVPRSEAYEQFIRELRVTNAPLAASVEGMVRDRAMDDTNVILARADRAARNANLPREKLMALFTRENDQGERVFNKGAALGVAGGAAALLFMAVFFSGTGGTPVRADSQRDHHANGAAQGALSASGTSAAGGAVVTVPAGGGMPPADAGGSSGNPLGLNLHASGTSGTSGGQASASPGGAVASAPVTPITPVNVTAPPPSITADGTSPVVQPSFDQAQGGYVPPSPTVVQASPYSAAPGAQVGAGEAGTALPVTQGSTPPVSPAGAVPVTPYGTPDAPVPLVGGTGQPAVPVQPGVSVQPQVTPPPAVTLTVMRVEAPASTLSATGGVAFRKANAAQVNVTLPPASTGAPGGEGAAGAPGGSGPSGAGGSRNSPGTLVAYQAPPDQGTTLTRILPASATSTPAAPQPPVSESPVAVNAAYAAPVTPTPTPIPAAVSPTPAAPAAPVSPYRLGQRVLATLETGVNIAQGGQTLPVYASTADGTLWRGTVSLDAARRVNVLFDRALLKDGTEVSVTASAYNLDGTPGLKAQYRDIAPTLASDLIRAAVSGVNDFVQATIQATTTTLSGGNAVVSRSAPSLLQSVAGSAAHVFTLPQGQQSFVPVAQLPVGAQFALVYGSVTAGPAGP